MYTNSTLLSNVCQQKKPLSTKQLLKIIKRKQTESNIASGRDFVVHVKSLYPTITPSCLQVLRFIIDHSNRMCYLNFSYAYIAGVLDISERTVVRSMDYLRKNGLIFTFWNERDTNSFYPHKNFLDVKVREKLKHIIPELGEKTYRVSVDSILQTPNNYTDRELIIDEVLTIKEDVLGKEQALLNIPPSYIYNWLAMSSRNIRVHAREAKQIVKREFDMTPMIEKVSSFLHLTQAGQVNLMAFPEDALGFASMMVGGGKNMEKLKDPYGYFVSQCKKFCREQSLSQNWSTVYRHRSLFGIKDTDPMVDTAAADAAKNKASQQAERKTGFSCKNGCSQPCDGWTWEHSQRGMCIKQGRDYNPFYLLQEPKTEGMAQLDISQASTPMTGFKRPSEVVSNMSATEVVTKRHELPTTQTVTNGHTLNLFEDSGDNWYPEANEDLEEIW